MEERIQKLLDSQWDALESRSQGVKKIRAEIAATLNELAVKLADDLNAVDATISSDKSTLSGLQRNSERRKELQRLLDRENESKVAVTSKQLSVEIDDVDTQIRELQQKRLHLTERLKESNAILASRTAKYEHALSDLNKEFSVDDYNHVGEMQQRVAGNEIRRESLAAEMEAATAGQELWVCVCEELKSLDSEIKGFKKEQLPQISFALEKTSNVIDGFLETASQSGWSALVVAIGHELQILHDTQRAVHDALKRDLPQAS